MDDYGNEFPQMGKVRRVFTGTHGGIAVVDGDGGSSPAALTALAAFDHAAYYVADGSGQGDEDMTWPAPKDAAENHLRIAAWERQPCKWLAGSGDAFEAAMADIATLRAGLAALADRVAALELERVAERGEM